MTNAELDALDRWIAENVMWWEWRGLHIFWIAGWYNASERFIASTFSPTRNETDCAKVIKEVIRLYGMTLRSASNGIVGVCIGGKEEIAGIARDKGFNVAICLAAKKALEAA